MGKLFVIDGTDGSGKQTQMQKLKERLDRENIEYMSVAFPNYEHPSSSLVKMYLSGEFGEHANDVSPYVASTFYAADRYATYKIKLEEYYNKGGIILADRYTSANMIHQAGKIKDSTERKNFLDWIIDLEFNIYKIPKPNIVFFLNMPPKSSLDLIRNRENKFSHNMQKDIHEKDCHHIEEAYNAACGLAKDYGWREVNCVENDKIRTVEDIHEEIFDTVRKELGKNIR